MKMNGPLLTPHQGCTNFITITEPPQNSRRQKADKMDVPHWRPTNIMRHHTKFNRHGERGPGLCASLHHAPQFDLYTYRKWIRGTIRVSSAQIDSVTTTGLRVFEKLHCGEHANRNEEEWQKTGEKCVLRSFMICTIPFITMEKSKGIIRLLATRERREIHDLGRKSWKDQTASGTKV
jgi:hypothetical protein